MFKLMGNSVSYWV